VTRRYPHAKVLGVDYSKQAIRLIAQDSSDEPAEKLLERIKAFTYHELAQRDKVSLDIFWLRDENMEDTESLPKL